MPCALPCFSRESASLMAAKRKRAAHVGIDLAGDVQREDLLLHAAHPVGRAVAVVGPLQAGHLDVLHQQVVGPDGRDVAGGKADHDHPAAPGHAPARPPRWQPPPTGSMTTSAPWPPVELVHVRRAAPRAGPARRGRSTASAPACADRPRRWPSPSAPAITIRAPSALASCIAGDADAPPEAPSTSTDSPAAGGARSTSAKCAVW